MGQKNTIAMIETAMVVCRQWNKLDAVRRLLPQKLEDGLLYNFHGQVIGSWDAEDQELCKLERVMDATKVTDALLNDIMKPANQLFGSAAEREEVEDDDDSEIEEASEAPETEETVDQDEEMDIKALKKQLKKLEKGTKEYKKLKKQIKGLKNG